MKRIANAFLLGLIIGSIGVAAWVANSGQWMRSDDCAATYEPQKLVIDYTKQQPYEESGQ